MSIKDVRAGISQAQMNEDSINYLLGEILIISIITGVITKSWWVFGAVLIGLFVGFMFKKIAIFLIILFSISWSTIGFIIGFHIGGFGAAFVIGFIILAISAGLHFSALEWLDDIGSNEG
jgi:hypothetical protein